jgi:hypothetical protein
VCKFEEVHINKGYLLLFKSHSDNDNSVSNFQKLNVDGASYFNIEPSIKPHSTKPKYNISPANVVRHLRQRPLHLQRQPYDGRPDDDGEPYDRWRYVS